MAWYCKHTQFCITAAGLPQPEATAHLEMQGFACFVVRFYFSVTIAQDTLLSSKGSSSTCTGDKASG